MPRACKDVWESWREKKEKGDREEEKRAERRAEAVRIAWSEVKKRIVKMGVNSVDSGSDGSESEDEKGTNSTVIRRRKAAGHGALKSPCEPKHNDARRSLPAFRHRTSVLSLVSRSRVTVVKGATGSGKSTQIPQYVVENFKAGSVMVTQVRRSESRSAAQILLLERPQLPPPLSPLTP